MKYSPGIAVDAQSSRRLGIGEVVKCSPGSCGGRVKACPCSHLPARPALPVRRQGSSWPTGGRTGGPCPGPDWRVRGRIDLPELLRSVCLVTLFRTESPRKGLHVPVECVQSISSPPSCALRLDSLRTGRVSPSDWTPCGGLHVPPQAGGPEGTALPPSLTGAPLKVETFLLRWGDPSRECQVSLSMPQAPSSSHTVNAHLVVCTQACVHVCKLKSKVCWALALETLVQIPHLVSD